MSHYMVKPDIHFFVTNGNTTPFVVTPKKVISFSHKPKVITLIHFYRIPTHQFIVSIPPQFLCLGKQSLLMPGNKYCKSFQSAFPVCVLGSLITSHCRQACWNMYSTYCGFGSIDMLATWAACLQGFNPYVLSREDDRFTCASRRSHYQVNYDRSNFQPARGL